MASTFVCFIRASSEGLNTRFFKEATHNFKFQIPMPMSIRKITKTLLLKAWRFDFHLKNLVFLMIFGDVDALF